jgi:hypothetical protein
VLKSAFNLEIRNNLLEGMPSFRVFFSSNLQMLLKAQFYLSKSSSSDGVGNLPQRKGEN